MRSDTPYSDLYERTQDVDALSACTVRWSLSILRDPKIGRDYKQTAKNALRLAMRYRREMRDKRNLILAESFKREVCGA